MKFPAWLAATVTLAGGVWAVDQFNRSYAWPMALLSLLSVLVVRVRHDPTVLQDIFIPWKQGS